MALCPGTVQNEVAVWQSSKKETHTVRQHASHTHLEFDVHLVSRTDCTGNISTCWFFALLGDRCFCMIGNHIFLPGMSANTMCVIRTSLRTFTLSIIKVDSPVTRSKIYSSRVQTKTDESVLEGCYHRLKSISLYDVSLTLEDEVDTFPRHIGNK
jgi:hypothetical protein